MDTDGEVRGADALRGLVAFATANCSRLVAIPKGSELAQRLAAVVGEVSVLVIETERVTLQREIEQLRELLEVKSAFLRMTVHELRRPLALANGHLSMLLDQTFGEMPDGMSGTLQRVGVNIHEIATIADGLAAIAPIEDRAAVLRREDCRITDLVRDAGEAVAPDAEEKSIEIRTKAPPDLRVPADYQLLRTALLNLLTNALKFAPADSAVVVQVVAHDDAVAIAVSNQGPGLAPEVEARAFDKYFRGQNDVAGLGLGLYIVQKIAELHGGRVTVVSLPGEGSTFTILLPSSASP